MKAKLTFILAHKSGAPTTTIEVEALLKLQGTTLNEHDLAAVFFAAEFAINNHASNILEKPLRAHFFLE